MKRFLSIKYVLFGFFILLLMLTTGQNILAQDLYYSQGAVNFTSITNWNNQSGGGGSAPPGTSVFTSGVDSFVVESNHSVTIDADIVVSALVFNSSTSPTINSGRSVRVNDSLRVIQGTVAMADTMIAGKVFVAGGTLTLANVSGNAIGTFSQSSGTFNGGTGEVDFNSITISGGTFNAASASYTTTVTAVRVDNTPVSSSRTVFDYSSGGTFTSSSSTFFINANTLALGGTSGSITATVTINAQSGTASFNNLEISGINSNSGGTGGARTRTIAFTGAGTIDIGTKLTRNNVLTSVTGTNLQYTTAELEYDVSTNTTRGAEWPSSSGPNDVVISSQTITLDQSSAINNLTLDGGSLTIGGSGSLTINSSGIALLRNNTLTVSNGCSLTVNGTLEMNGGTLTDNSGSGGNFGYGSGPTGDLKYSASSAQLIANEWTNAVNPRDVIITNTNNVDLGSANRSIRNLTLSSSELLHSGILSISGDVAASTGSYGTTGGGTLSVSGTSNKIVATGNLSIDNLTIASTSGELNGITINDNLTVNNTSGNVRLTGPITVADNCTLTVSGSGGLLNLAGQSLTVGSTGTRLVVNGTLQTGGSSYSGFNSYSLGGTVEYTGSVAETMLGLTFTNLTINNSSNDGVSVSTSTSPTVSGTLTLTDGNLNTSNGTFTLLSGATIPSGSINSFLDGPVDIQTASTSEVVLPLGENGTWRRIGITPASSGSTTYRAEFNDSDPQNGGTRTTLGAGVTVVSTASHWTVSRQSGSANAQIRLYWESTSDGVQNPNTLLVVHWTGSAWAHSGGGSGDTGTGNSSSGNVLSALSFSSFGDFALGSSASDNSLPVLLTSFTADADFGRITLNWRTESEIDNQGFNIYRATETDPDNWTAINYELIPGAGNTSAKTEYSYIDQNVQSGETYNYRLESISYNGVRELFVESTVTIVVPMPNEFALLDNYPNPFNPVTNIMFQVPDQSVVSLIIYDVQGNLVKKLLSNSTYQPGEHVVQWDATDNSNRQVSTGVYFYQFVSRNFQKIGKMMLIK